MPSTRDAPRSLQDLKDLLIHDVKVKIAGGLNNYFINKQAAENIFLQVLMVREPSDYDYPLRSANQIFRLSVDGVLRGKYMVHIVELIINYSIRALNPAPLDVMGSPRTSF